MASGYGAVVAGNPGVAADATDYWSKQVVMVFASAAARDTALSAVLREGMVAYLLDLNCLTIYTGAAWSTVGPVHGALTSWTPAVVQLGAVTTTNNDSTYQRIGRRITAPFYVTVTGAGTVANEVTISLPVLASGTAGQAGEFHLRDNSTGLNYAGILKLSTTSTARLLVSAIAGVDADNYFGTGASYNVALAVNDYIMGEIRYTAGADA